MITGNTVERLMNSGGGHTESTRSSTGGKGRQPLDQSKNQTQTLRPIATRNRSIRQ